MKPSHFSSLIIYADGSWTPEGAGAGVIVMDTHNQLLHIENRVFKAGDNNEAEYVGLIMGLEVAIDMNADVVEMRLDSEVVVKQMLGTYAVRSSRLKTYHWQACQLALNITRVRYIRIPRERNGLADALAGEASSGRQWQIGVR